MSTEFIIYKYTSPSGKSYIGQTNDPARRKRLHRNVDGCRALYRAIQKYGWDNMSYEVLETGLTLEDANRLEAHYIKLHDTMSPNGYNLTSGGENFFLSEETRQRISNSKKGHLVSTETRQKISDTVKSQNRTRSQETRNKISQTRKQKGLKPAPKSEEGRLRLSQFAKNRQHSEETRRKISESNKGKKLTPEQIAKRQASRLANKLRKQVD